MHPVEKEVLQQIADYELAMESETQKESETLTIPDLLLFFVFGLVVGIELGVVIS
jgi:type II secretory pathway component PulF